ncbi:MAG: hypothetical protein HN675_10730 [Opitutae bacterium]|nr:hypothetical protein [Opitutae bacterium]
MNAKGGHKSLILAVIGLFASNCLQGDDDLRLKWVNGDSLPGQIKSFTNKTLTWASPLFSRNLAINAKGLESIVFPTTEDHAGIPETFRIVTLGGDRIMGNLKAMDIDTLTIESARHGRIELKRNKIAFISRVESSNLIVPGTIKGWQPLNSDTDIRHWSSSTRGHIQTSRARSKIFKALDFPEIGELEVALSWEQQPGFTFRFVREDGTPLAGGFSLETWDDELVIMKGRQFESISKIPNQPGSVHLRIYINRKSGEITVRTYDGRKLAGISGEPDNEKSRRGILLFNKRQNLTLETLRVAKWKNQIPKPTTEGRNRLHTTEGGLIYGLVKSYDAASKMLLIEGGPDDFQELQIDRLDTLHLSPIGNSPSKDLMQISFLDGTVLHGTLTGLTPDKATIRHSISENPLTCTLVDCREIRLSTRAQKLPENLQQQFEMLVREKKDYDRAGELLKKWAGQFPGDATIPYNLACIKALGGQIDEAFALLGKSIKMGFRDTAHIKNDRDLTNLREDPRFEQALNSSREPEPQSPEEILDVLHWEGGSNQGTITTMQGDDFPIGWQPMGTTEAVPLVKTAKIRVVRHNAINGVNKEDTPNVLFLTNQTAIPCKILQIDKNEARVKTPFNREPIKLSQDLIKAIEFNRPATIIGFGDEAWRFGGTQSSWFFDEKLATFTKRGQLTHPTALRGSSIRFTLEWKTSTYFQMKLRLFADNVEVSGSPAMDYSIYSSTSSISIQAPGQVRRHSVRLDYKNKKKQKAHFTINCTNQIEILINGEEALTQDITKERPGTGIAFSMSSLSSKKNVSISEFSADMRGDQPAIYPKKDILEKVLTIPRILKSNPPHHVIAAPNGDLLRGKLISLDEEITTFSSKFRDISIPRDRVAGIVWLQDNNEHAEPLGGIRLILGESRSLAVEPLSFKDNILYGQSPVFGHCRIPLEDIHEIHLGNFVQSNQMNPYSDWKLKDITEQPNQEEDSI